MGRPASPQITRELNLSWNDLPSQPIEPMGVDDKPTCVPKKDNDSKNSTEHLAKLMAPDTSSEEEVAWLGHGRLIELERQLLTMHAVQTERDRRISQLTDQLVQKSALVEQAEANAASVKMRAGLEQRDLQAKLDEMLLSRDQALEQVQSALQQATFRAAEANEQSQRELAEAHAKLKAKETELTAVRLRLTDAEDSWTKSEAAEAGTSRAASQAAVGPVNMDMDRVVWRLMERVRAVEADVALLRRNEKGIEEMECRVGGINYRALTPFLFHTFAFIVLLVIVRFSCVFLAS